MELVTVNSLRSRFVAAWKMKRELTLKLMTVGYYNKVICKTVRAPPKRKGFGCSSRQPANQLVTEHIVSIYRCRSGPNHLVEAVHLNA